MADPDLLDGLQAGREAIRRLQQSLSRNASALAMTPEQRQAVLGGLAQLMFPTDGVRALSDLVDAFGPPVAQIEALRDELAEQRALLSKLDDRLNHLENSAERLALASEQVVAFREPLVRLAAMIVGSDSTTGPPDGDGDPTPGPDAPNPDAPDSDGDPPDVALDSDAVAGDPDGAGALDD